MSLRALACIQARARNDKGIMSIKDFLTNYQNDIVLLVGIILISLISFGAGRLTAPGATTEPIKIDDSQVANISQTFLKQNAPSQTETGAQTNNTNQPSQVNTNNDKNQGQFVASKSGKNYYWPWDPGAQRIKPENLVWFATEAQAQAAGLKRNASFSAQAPAGYQVK